jgi:hypothetical protein
MQQSGALKLKISNRKLYQNKSIPFKNRFCASFSNYEFNKSGSHFSEKIGDLNVQNFWHDGEGQQDDYDCFDHFDTLDDNIDELENRLNAGSPSEVDIRVLKHSDTESRAGDDEDDKLNRDIAAQNDLVAFGIKDLFANSGDWDGRILSLSFPKVVIMVRLILCFISIFINSLVTRKMILIIRLSKQLSARSTGLWNLPLHQIATSLLT